ncbi:MAG: DNA polymerase IV [Kiritimatiellia bacterium]
MDKTFLHVDMDAFFASVEQHDHPELKGRPVVVGAPADKRGVVAAASYEARKYGIHSAMPSREAYRRYPEAVFLPVNGKRYREVSEQILGIFERFTPLLEPLSIDEAFLDVTGARSLFGTGREIAGKIKSAVTEETGLTASVGVAPNKFLAKLASDLEKPDGLVVVPSDRKGILEFLAPLPVSRIWGVGRVTQKGLADAGIDTIKDLQEATRSELADIVGANSADHMLALAHGVDERDIELNYEEKSISREYTFPEDCSENEIIRDVLIGLADDVGRRLREAGKYASIAHLKLRWRDFRTITRQKPFVRPCCDDATLRETALRMFRHEKLIGPVRLIGFGVSNLQQDPAGTVQLDLFEQGAEDTQEKREALSRVVDEIKARFGPESIRRPSSRA